MDNVDLCIFEFLKVQSEILILNQIILLMLMEKLLLLVYNFEYFVNQI